MSSFSVFCSPFQVRVCDRASGAILNLINRPVSYLPAASARFVVLERFQSTVARSVHPSSPVIILSLFITVFYFCILSDTCTANQGASMQVRGQPFASNPGMASALAHGSPGLRTALSATGIKTRKFTIKDHHFSP